MNISVSSELLSEVKNFLDITWNDDAGDEKLSGIVLRGMLRINEICGTEFDFSENGNALAKDLLLNYVIYARSNALDEFMKNYQAEFNYLQLTQEALNYVKS